MTESPSSPQTRPPETAPDQASFSKQSRDRVMSDVRYMLHQPSTPWIVFDRKSNAGEPATADISSEPQTSTSTPTSTSTTPTSPCPALVPFELEAPVHVAPLRVASWKVGVAAAVLAVLAGVVLFVTLHRIDPAPAVAPSSISAPRPPAETSIATNVSPDFAVGADRKLAAKSSAPSWLAVRGNAGIHRIYLDGKLLLGNGTRSFPVKCGMHTIAVSDRKNTREVDVPCGGELVLRE